MIGKLFSAGRQKAGAAWLAGGNVAKNAIKEAPGILNTARERVGAGITAGVAAVEKAAPSIASGAGRAGAGVGKAWGGIGSWGQNYIGGAVGGRMAQGAVVGGVGGAVAGDDFGDIFKGAVLGGAVGGAGSFMAGGSFAVGKGAAKGLGAGGKAIASNAAAAGNKIAAAAPGVARGAADKIKSAAGKIGNTAVKSNQPIGPMTGAMHGPISRPSSSGLGAVGNPRRRPTAKQRARQMLAVPAAMAINRMKNGVAMASNSAMNAFTGMASRVARNTRDVGRRLPHLGRSSRVNPSRKGGFGRESMVATNRGSSNFRTRKRYGSLKNTARY